MKIDNELKEILRTHTLQELYDMIDTESIKRAGRESFTSMVNELKISDDIRKLFHITKKKFAKKQIKNTKLDEDTLMALYFKGSDIGYISSGPINLDLTCNEVIHLFIDNNDSKKWHMFGFCLRGIFGVESCSIGSHAHYTSWLFTNKSPEEIIGQYSHHVGNSHIKANIVPRISK